MAFTERRFVCSATFAIAVTTDVIPLARWLMVASFRVKAFMASSRCSIEAVMLSRPPRPCSATWAASRATPVTLLVASRSCSPVAEISVTAAEISLAEPLNPRTARSWRVRAAVALASTLDSLSPAA